MHSSGGGGGGVGGSGSSSYSAGATGHGPQISTIESELERAREEGNWKRVVELAEQLRCRPDKQFETLGCFLIGEGKLEDFLDEYPPKECNIPKAKAGLQEAKQYLSRTIGDEAKKLGVHLDSYILLGKIHYAMGMYAEALKYYERAQLDTLEEKALPARSLKIIAEAFAIKGLCYEKLPSHTTSKQKMVERENNIIRSYELAADLTLLFLQTADRASASGRSHHSTWSVTSVGTSTGSSSPVPPYSVQHKLGYILETALMKAPTLNLRAGKVDKAVSRLRAMLVAEESESTKGIRHNVARQLCETLIQNVSDVRYSKPEADSSPQHHRRPSSRNHAMESPWKPGKHGMAPPPVSISSAAAANAMLSIAGAAGGVISNVFVPKSKIEEVVLLLLISEYMACKEAVLSQSPEFTETRKRTYNNATSVYDLMSITLVRHGSFRLLCDMLERSMKFSFAESHTWTQFAMALASEGRYFRSLLVYRQVAEQSQTEVGSCLVVARLCYEKLALHEEGLEWSKKAMERDKATGSHHKARCHIYIGVGYSMTSYNIENREERTEKLNLAKKNFEEAIKIDPRDHLAEFYLAFHLSRMRHIASANDHAHKALRLQPDHFASLHLLILLLSAAGEREAALELTIQTLEEYPDSLSLLSLKVRLEEVVKGAEVAMLTAKTMLAKWQVAFENKTILDSLENGRGRNVYDTLSDKDSVSLHAQSITASHVEKTLSEVASSMSSNHMDKADKGTSGQDGSSYAQMRIWLLTAELHLRHGNVEAAEQCALEARAIAPLSYHLMYVRGLINEALGDLEAAQQCYENSLGVNPSYVNSLYHLGRVYHAQGFNRLAEQTLKIAVRLDPSIEGLWSLLGDVTEAVAVDLLCQGQEATGSDDLCSIGDCDDESENTPTEENKNYLLAEAKKLFTRASEAHAIALSVQNVSPIIPFTSIPLVFE